MRIYQHGNTTFAGEAFERDRLLDRDGTWATSTAYQVNNLIFDDITGLVYKCLLAHISGTTFEADRASVPPLWQVYNGIDFTFQIELPWMDSKDPMKIKFLRFLAMATKGNARFTVNAYVDNLFKNVNGDVIWQPALSMNFVGNEAVGFGYDAGMYGGGRRSDDPRLWKFPAKFKKLKLTINGTRGGMLELVYISFLFNRGRYKR
jgi:hypothetical protein